MNDIIPQKQDVLPFLHRHIHDLPSMSVVAVKMLKLTRDPNAKIDDLVRVIETDPAIATKVLRMVNSAAYGFAQKIASVKHGVVLLGFQTIRSLAFEVTLFEQMVKARNRRIFDRMQYWRHCLSVAALSSIIAEEVGFVEIEEAYTAGLLHDIGKIISDAHLKVGYADVLQRQEKYDGPLIEIEKRLSGISHDELGAYVCSEWGLPQKVVLAIRLHHCSFGALAIDEEVKTLVAIVALANFITWLLGLGSVKLFNHSVLPPEVEERIPFHSLNLQKIVDQMNTAVANVAEFYEFSFPSPEQFRENLLMANISLSRINTKYYYGQNQSTSRPDLLRKIKKSMMLPHRSLDQAEIIPMTLRAIQQDFAFDRVYLFGIDKGQRSLVVQHFLDNSTAASRLEGFEVAINSGLDGLIDCLRQQIPVVVCGRTAGEREFLQGIGADEVVAVPVVGNNKINGLLAADYASSGKKVNEDDLPALAIVASELGMALENARMFDEARNLAFTDGLTKIHNRAYLNKMLAAKVAAAQSGEAALAIGLVDVDFFKQFNDHFGHLTGDLVLKLLAGTMKKFSRPSDIVGRYGGEEFMFLISDAGLAEAVSFGERLRREIESLGFTLQKRFPGRPLTISVGVAAYSPQLTGVEELIHKADQALYLAKESGRNNVKSADQVEEQSLVSNL